MRLTHIFTIFLMIFKNYVFYVCPKKVDGGKFLGGCFRVLWVHGTPPGECVHFFLGPRGVPWSGQSSHHDDFLLKSCIGFNSFVFRLLRFWERLGRLPNVCFAAKQVPGTPPEKLNSDFGAKK